MSYLPDCQPMAPIAEGNFPMGISKLAPNLYFIKARVKLAGARLAKSVRLLK